MTITRRERIREENRLTKLNNKSIKSANLRKNVTFLGGSLVVGGVFAQLADVSTTVPVYAEATSTSTTDSTTSVTGMVTPRGVGDQNFINYIGNSARKLADNNDIYASVMIAQAMVESGWGTSGLASAPNYNLFGVKGSYNGESVNMGTQEDDGTGSLYSISSNFRKYPSYKESLEDYVSLIRGGVSGNPEIYAGAWKSNTESYKDATAYLTGRYATDTTYADKLNAIIQKYDLTKFDTDTDSQDQTYVFASGDTLQSVADKFNMTVETLMGLNNLKTSSYVYPGKTLTVLKVIGNDSTDNQQPVTVTNTASVTGTTDSSATATSSDVYGNDQAPIIVQDETDGVKKYDASNSSSNTAVSVKNTLTTGTTGASNNSSTETDNSSTATNDSTDSSVTVQDGDTIDSIASQANTTADQIKQDNNLNSDLLVVGQKLMV
ncbi:glucosaminidase domain-containing protein [Companilactobacillus jidongensis]|uniref:glucosaminidase domain-containing protein n=1 Tax=Companilactobacillus jidongensis TaxID=2486006 RepID=UPI000F76DF29|nr:glucosaminidase domain-containing protein [Companilactobacillus jidongensis]